MLRRILLTAAMCALPVIAQEAEYGISVPVTASFGAMDTHRFNFGDPNASPAAANFRLMLYPTLRLGKHWFAYAAVQVRRRPYYYYDAFLPERGMDADIIQGFLGYTFRTGPATVVFKAGQLNTAFGSFPQRYDDAENPLIDQPFSYITQVTLRTDQLSCGTADLLRQFYGSVEAGCGGEAGRDHGTYPVTLYGLPGVQGEVSIHKFDARVQMTTSSPAYPDGWKISRQYLQATVGGGFSISQGFRVGVSAFRGPYLESSVSPWLPGGTTVRSFPAVGRGLDVQWARGRFSANGELHRFRLEAPNFVVHPEVSSVYAEVKGRITPRLYAAVREGYFWSGTVSDKYGVSAPSFLPAMRATEVGFGFWVMPRVLFKTSYVYQTIAGSSGTKSNVLGMQLVATFKQLQWAFR